MSIARVTTVQPQVLTGTIVTIEADISRGLHAFSIVGLAGKAIDESKDRVSSAIKHSGFDSPKTKKLLFHCRLPTSRKKVLFLTFRLLLPT